MHRITKVKIDGFWSDKTVNFELNKDINFLIGVNGSGKTTIINLIAATLNADFSTLDKVQFDRIKIDLEDKKTKSGERQSAFIQVDKKEKKNSPYPEIIFKIKKYENKEPKKFNLDELEEDRLIRSSNGYIIHRGAHRGRRSNRNINIVLEELVSITWLSVHRSNATNRGHEDKGAEPAIDRKIQELQNELIKYFSQLSGKCAMETNDFQKYIFQSLLDSGTQDALYKTASSIKLNDEKRSLQDIFSHFNLKEDDMQKKLNKCFNSFGKSIKNADKQGMSVEDFSHLLTIVRIHSVVQKWSELKKREEDINKPRNVFLNLINNLLQRKELLINEKNELTVKTESGKFFPLANLSSGEKQLLIILGQSLLQESKNHIYIADEPELSLHVDWQEQLVSSLKSLNPNSQILFATHSPDIVSQFSSSTIKIEEAIA